MFLVAIKQEKSGKNTHFITDDFKEYVLNDIVDQVVPLSFIYGFI
jgi:hypothetical protein